MKYTTLILMLLCFVGKAQIGNDNIARNGAYTSYAIVTSVSDNAKTSYFGVGTTNCTISGCHCTIESNCYEIEVLNSTHVIVKSGGQFITVDSCHNIIIDTGSELNIKGVSNRRYWKHPIDSVWINGINGELQHVISEWRWETIKEIPKPECNY